MITIAEDIVLKIAKIETDVTNVVAAVDGLTKIIQDGAKKVGKKLKPDLNEDGTVSAREAFVYNMMQDMVKSAQKFAIYFVLIMVAFLVSSAVLRALGITIW